MSDPDDDSMPPMFAMPIALTPEMREQIMASQLSQDIEINEQAHKQLDLLRTFNEEQLKWLQSTIHYYSSEENSPAMAFFSAALIGELYVQFGICPACGEKHEPGIAEIKADAAESRRKIQYLVNYLHGRELLEEGTFTFPDGDTWESGGS